MGSNPLFMDLSLDLLMQKTKDLNHRSTMVTNIARSSLIHLSNVRSVEQWLSSCPVTSPGSRPLQGPADIKHK